MATHERVVEAFRYGDCLKGHNVFAEKNVLYSYGYHFPLVIDVGSHFLCNSDKYSVSTSKHQSYTFSVFGDSPRISFNALMGVLNTNIKDFVSRRNYQKLEILDFTKDRSDYSWDTSFKEAKNWLDNNAPAGSTKSITENHDKTYDAYYHIVGSCLIKYGKRYLLNSVDENIFFCSELPRKCKTVNEAFQMLKPKEIQEAEKNGLEVLRQGEWFFIPVDKNLVPKKTPSIMALPTPKGRMSSNVHVVSKMIKHYSAYYCTGKISHKHPRRYMGDPSSNTNSFGSLTGEHATKYCKGKWYRAYRNTEKMSRTVNGFD